MSSKFRTSHFTLCISARVLVALALVGAIGLLLGGCGGDDEESSGTPSETLPAATLPEPVTAPPPETTRREEPAQDPDREPRTVPEEEQQGDEEAIRSEAVFTGRGGKLGPREIRVPAFIAIRVILRNGDGGSYSMEIDGQRLIVGHAKRTDEAKLDGLLPQKRYVGKSPQGDVVISATAEPGP